MFRFFVGLALQILLVVGVYLVYQVYKRVTVAYPGIKLSEKARGYVGMTVGVGFVIGLFIWPFVLPGLFTWLHEQPVPIWLKDLMLD